MKSKIALIIICFFIGYQANKTNSKKVTNEELKNFEYVLTKENDIKTIKAGKINTLGIKVEKLVDRIIEKFLG